MSRANFLGLLDDLEQVFHNPNFLGFSPLVKELRSAASLASNYPPRNIIKTGDDAWMLEVALAGFSAHEIDVSEHNGVLTVSGRSSLAERAGAEYLHQGIARRDFSFTVKLAEHVNVSEEYPPLMQNGVLIVNFIRNVPESAQPKKFKVTDPSLPKPESPVA